MCGWVQATPVQRHVRTTLSPEAADCSDTRHMQQNNPWGCGLQVSRQEVCAVPNDGLYGDEPRTPNSPVRGCCALPWHAAHLWDGCTM